MNNNIISRYFFLLLSLLILSSLAQRQPCKYINNSYSVKTTNDKDYLDKVTGDEAKQKCFILSKSKENENNLCCYNEQDKCYLDNSPDNEDCPKETVIVNNNCGMAYIYQPVFPGICNEISLVQGYCCFIEYKYSKEGDTEEKTASACVKTKELKKNINSSTIQMEDYIKNFKVKKDNNNNDVVYKIKIERVVCNQFFLKYFYNLIIFTTILLL